jgi:hypothetical protein
MYIRQDFASHNYYFFVGPRAKLFRIRFSFEPLSLSTLNFQVATFQKRATLAGSPQIPTNQQVRDRRPLRRTSDP